MKSLKESLFDKNLISKKLSIEKYIDDFSSNALEELEPETRNTLFDQLFEGGTVCNAYQLMKNPIDTTKNIIIIRTDDDKVLNSLNEMNYVRRYNFIYSIYAFNHSFMAELMNTGKYYYWDTERLDKSFDKKATWKAKIASIYKPNCTYSVISNEKWVNNIINAIMMD